jgi:hypothetical protein
MSLTLAIRVQAVELSSDRSQSFAKLRHRRSHANVRSTTHRRGRTSNPFAVSERLMISIVQSPRPLSAAFSLSPAQPPSANTWRSQGNRRRMARKTSGAPSRSWMPAEWMKANSSKPSVSS